MLCGSLGCGCAIQSVGLEVSGSGAPGDPWIIEPAGPGIVSTSAAVTTPFLGQTIYETSTGRMKVYNGSAWVLLAGNMPMVSLLGGVTAHADGVAEPFVLGTEIYDTDAFHASTNGFITIPSTLGGVYLVTAGVQYAANATSYRTVRLTVANNTGVTPAEPSTITSGGFQSVNTANTGQVISKHFRLRAAATISAAGIQLSGGSLNTAQMFLTATMVRHEPALV